MSRPVRSAELGVAWVDDLSLTADLVMRTGSSTAADAIADAHRAARESAASQLGSLVPGIDGGAGSINVPWRTANDLMVVLDVGLAAGATGLFLLDPEGREHTQSSRAVLRSGRTDERPDVVGPLQMLESGGGLALLRAERLCDGIARLVDCVATAMDAHVDAVVLAGRVPSSAPTLRLGDRFVLLDHESQDDHTVGVANWTTGHDPAVVEASTSARLLLRVSMPDDQSVYFAASLAPFWPVLRLSVPMDTLQPVAVYGHVAPRRPDELVASAVDSLLESVPAGLGDEFRSAHLRPTTLPGGVSMVLSGIGPTATIRGNFVGAPIVRSLAEPDALLVGAGGRAFVMDPSFASVMERIVSGLPVLVGELDGSTPGGEGSVEHLVRLLALHGLIRVELPYDD